MWLVGGRGEVKQLKDEHVLVRGEEREVLIEQQSLLPLRLKAAEKQFVFFRVNAQRDAVYNTNEKVMHVIVCIMFQFCKAIECCWGWNNGVISLKQILTAHDLKLRSNPFIFCLTCVPSSKAV